MSKYLILKSNNLCFPILSRVPRTMFIRFQDHQEQEEDIAFLDLDPKTEVLVLSSKTIYNLKLNVPGSRNLAVICDSKPELDNPVNLFGLNDVSGIKNLEIKNMSTYLPDSLNLKSLKIENTKINNGKCIKNLIDKTPVVSIKNCLIPGFSKPINFNKI